MKKLIVFMLLCSVAFGKIVIKDDCKVVSEQFIEHWESQYKDKNKEIHVLIKGSIGKEKPVVYGAEYIQSKDLGGKGSGIVILIIMDIKHLQVVTGDRVDEIFTDTQIDKLITRPMLKDLYKGDFELSIKNSINTSIKILNEVVK